MTITYDEVDLEETERERTPSYRDCHRCGIRLPGTEAMADYCTSCTAVRKRTRRDLANAALPDFDINIYTRHSSRYDTGKTIPTLRAAKINYSTANMYDDGVILAWLYELTGGIPRSTVTISRPGELLDWWEGDRPDKVAEWIAKATASLELAA